ncbi:SpoIIE family protein phosphatase [bacterium]|nr:SpoIIE family protein phosphatase [bacterium]
MPTVLLSAAPAQLEDLRRDLEAGGFAVVGHDLGAAPAVDFAPVAVAVVVAGPVAAAASQTRRWRAELADEFVPVLWLVDRADAVPAGLDAGADVCLVQPVEPALLAAQLRALARTRASTARVSTRAAEARLLGDQLRQAFARLDADRDLARRVHRAALPVELPAGVSVCHRPRGRIGADFYDVRRAGDRLAFLVGDVPGRGGATGSLLGLLALRAAFPPGDADLDSAAALARVNRELLALGLDDPPLVALLAGVADGDSVTVARAGLPAPIWLPADGEAEAWAAPGPFLGTAEATYPALTRTLNPGDRLLIGTDGAGGGDALLAAARRHRGVDGAAFVEAVAADVLPAAPDGEDVTLLVVARGL